MKCAFVLPLLALLAACGADPDADFAKAKREFAAHDYPSARVHLASALAARPDDRPMQELQVRTLIALGDGEGARSAIDRLTGGKPQGEWAELAAEAALLRGKADEVAGLLGSSQSAAAEHLRALAALQKKDLAAAETHFAKADKAGGGARVLADFARLRLLQDKVAEARALHQRAVKADPAALDTLLVGGQLALRSGDLALALEQYERASTLYPASLAALTGKAAVLGDLGRTADMDAAVSRAAAFAPRDPTVIYLKARAAAARKDWGAVRDTVQAHEANLAANSPARLLYGEALLRLGQPALAQVQLRPFGSNRTAVRLMAEAQLAGGDAAGAVATLRPLADQPIASTDELALMARAAKAAGDARADRYAQRARTPAPQAVLRDLTEGDAAIRAQDWARAITAYERVLAVTDGRNAMVLNNMAYSQLMVGNLDKARSFADRALKLAPGDAAVLDTAGWVRIRQGKEREQALRMLRDAAARAPGNQTIRAHLAEAERAR